MPKKRPVFLPLATYRLQLTHAFTFDDAASITDYLSELGITHCYTSPFLKARPGSTHGYDVTDHHEINPELKGEPGLRQFSAGLQRRGLGIIADVVPNHMCVAHSDNRWWWDVLENGPSSPHARTFDIDWTPPKEGLVNRVLLPVLGDQFGHVLEEGHIRIHYQDGGFGVNCYDKPLPLAPRTWAVILSPVLDDLRAQFGEEFEDTAELASILTAIHHLPSRIEVEEDRVKERYREKEVIRRRIAALAERNSMVAAGIDRSLENLNGKPGDPRSFDALESLLNEQVYRLAFWRVAADEINYRRFFDINDLAAIRVEDDGVYQATHELLFQLVREGVIDGFRIDHPDGLYHPERYYRMLQESAAEALRARGIENPESFYIVAEKILTGDEELRSDWLIEGTTGYGFLNFLNGVFVDSAKRRAMLRIYERFTGWTQSYRDLIYGTKKLIMQVSMSSELNVLARRLDEISEQHRWFGDFTLENLRDALREVIACFPIYRTYIDPTTVAPDAEDQRHIRTAIAEAKRRNRAVNESVFDFIGSVLLLEAPEGLSEEALWTRRLWILRLQQYTGALMAKGLEDTAFYRYFPLASLNEVGGEPEMFGISAQIFHQKNLIRAKELPYAMLASSTHDTKRGEDHRARINVLSEIPSDWYRALEKWSLLNRGLKTDIHGDSAPDANEEYLFYQTLVGIWPFHEPSAGERKTLVDRLIQYMEKALREAKINSSWVSPNQEWEDATRRFITDALDAEKSGEFLADFEAFHAKLRPAGVLNSLSQTLLKIASPGVPDIYQGCEMWNFSLVDPDNRLPVDYERRKQTLEELKAAVAGGTLNASELLRHPETGAIKLLVTRQALLARQQDRELHLEGNYQALRVIGSKQNHVIAFSRQYQGRHIIAAAGRFFMGLGIDEGGSVPADAWEDAAIVLKKLPAGMRYRDLISGAVVHTAERKGQTVIAVREVFSSLPVALLVTETDSGPADNLGTGGEESHGVE